MVVAAVDGFPISRVRKVAFGMLVDGDALLHDVTLVVLSDGYTL